MMILIDDYDGLATGIASSSRPLTPAHESMLNQIQSTFHAFFAILHECVNLGNVQVYLTGVLPMKLSAQEDSGFQGSLMYHYPWGKLSKLFGFSMDDVYRGVSMLELPSDCSEEMLVRQLALLHVGFRFRRCSLKSLFNPARIQFILNHLSLHAKFDPTMSTTKLLQGLAAICEPFPSSVSSSLSLASTHPLLPWILRESLYSTSGTKATELERFDLLQLATLREAQKSMLLSYLCFTGALTHELVPDYQNPYRLTVPNGYTRTEFLNTLRNAINARPGALANLHAAIHAIPNAHSLSPFIISLQYQLITAFESYDTGVLEHELRTLTYTSLLMCCLQTDDVYSEPKLDTYASSNEASNESITTTTAAIAQDDSTSTSSASDTIATKKDDDDVDGAPNPTSVSNGNGPPLLPFKNMYGSEDQYVVYRTGNVDETTRFTERIRPKRFVFDFKAIPIAHIQEFVDVKWERRFEANRALAQLTDDTILQMSYRDLFSQPFKRISTALAQACQELSRTIERMNHEVMMEGGSEEDEWKHGSEGRAVGIVILRIGLYRLIAVVVNPGDVQPNTALVENAHTEQQQQQHYRLTCLGASTAPM